MDFFWRQSVSCVVVVSGFCTEIFASHDTKLKTNPWQRRIYAVGFWLAQYVTGYAILDDRLGYSCLKDYTGWEAANPFAK